MKILLIIVCCVFVEAISASDVRRSARSCSVRKAIDQLTINQQILADNQRAHEKAIYELRKKLDQTNQQVRATQRALVIFERQFAPVSQLERWLMRGTCFAVLMMGWNTIHAAEKSKPYCIL